MTAPSHQPGRPQPTVFIVDDDVVFICLMGAILRQAKIASESFAAPEALLERLTPEDRGCVVIDLWMPGQTGLELQQNLQARGIDLPQIFVSARADVQAAVEAMKHGAADFLCKPFNPEELLEVVRRALARDAEAASTRGERLALRSRWQELSPREQDVCRLAARGLLNKQIAAALGIAESTAQTQRSSALRKLRVQTSADLARLLAELGEPMG